MSTAIELLRQGRKHELWTKYCGFLDLNIDQFMEIQERLLMEQIELVSDSIIGQRFIGDNNIKSLDEFRSVVPITSYEDYEEYFDEKREDVLPSPAYCWARTSGRSGKMKWIPYTEQSYHRLGERVLAGVILAAARGKGDVNIAEQDVLISNTPPRPFVSGVCIRALAKQFNFQFVPPLDKTEEMGFAERIEYGFDVALRTGIDILGSLSVVLVKMGERFAEGANTTKFSMKYLHPTVLTRMIRAYIRSKLEKRPMLPKDLWKIKAIPTGGMDTSLYKDKIEYYWGIPPFEQYGSTEAGAIATQTWNTKGMTFFPDGAFLEFIAEEEWAAWRKDKTYIPKTVMLNEVKPGKRYELVITNFYGKPLLRYRMNDLVKFEALEDKETGVMLPQMLFAGRTSDVIDLAGYTGLIDEKLVWKAILNSGVQYEEWSIRKEVIKDNPILHLYIELTENINAETVRQKVHQNLKELNPSYADYESMIEAHPLKVTLLESGAFLNYMKIQTAAGADLAHIKPPHMNASDEAIEVLVNYSNEPE